MENELLEPLVDKFNLTTFEGKALCIVGTTGLVYDYEPKKYDTVSNFIDKFFQGRVIPTEKQRYYRSVDGTFEAQELKNAHSHATFNTFESDVCSRDHDTIVFFYQSNRENAFNWHKCHQHADDVELVIEGIHEHGLGDDFHYVTYDVYSQGFPQKIYEREGSEWRVPSHRYYKSSDYEQCLETMAGSIMPKLEPTAEELFKWIKDSTDRDTSNMPVRPHKPKEEQYTDFFLD